MSLTGRFTARFYIAIFVAMFSIKSFAEITLPRLEKLIKGFYSFGGSLRNASGIWAK